MRHLSLVEWRARSGVSHEPSFLREGRQFKFNVHGEVQRPRIGGNRLPQVDKVGENIKRKEGTRWDGNQVPIKVRP